MPPNILLIVTDDQPKRRTWKREVMPKTFSRMIDGGVEYELGFTATPLCTPTRWSMISGRWQHTHQCTENTANGYSEGKNKGLLNDTPATRLSELGYRVGYYGKFQNGYFNLPTDLAPGYDLSGWFVHANKIVPNESEHTFNEFGTIRKYPQPPNYTSHLITDRVEQFLDDQTHRPEPFFLTVSYLSPHDPYNPVPEHEHDFDGYPLEMVPSMDAMSAIAREQQRVVQEGKLEEVREIDNAVERIYAKLEGTGQLENTYIIYTTDHGYLLGEHGNYRKDKWWHEAIHIPFAVTGPGVVAGAKSRALASQIDIPTTICDLAGASWSDWDGRSLAPTFGGQVPEEWRTKLLVESLNSKWSMIRTEEYAYISRYTNKSEPYLLFDLLGDDADPYELTNIIATPKGQQVKAQLQPALEALCSCKGDACRVAET